MPDPILLAAHVIADRFSIRDLGAANEIAKVIRRHLWDSVFPVIYDCDDPPAYQMAHSALETWMPDYDYETDDGSLLKEGDLL